MQVYSGISELKLDSEGVTVKLDSDGQPEKTILDLDTTAENNNCFTGLSFEF